MFTYHGIHSTLHILHMGGPISQALQHPISMKCGCGPPLPPTPFDLLASHKTSYDIIVVTLRLAALLHSMGYGRGQAQPRDRFGGWHGKNVLGLICVRMPLAGHYPAVVRTRACGGAHGGAWLVIFFFGCLVPVCNITRSFFTPFFCWYEPDDEDPPPSQTQSSPLFLTPTGYPPHRDALFAQRFCAVWKKGACDCHSH
jgi:hypothetical protein